MRAAVGEWIGTALLVAAIAGSGIMGERLAGGNMALALLANSMATGAMLVALIFTFAPISGAHFNRDQPSEKAACWPTPIEIVQHTYGKSHVVQHDLGCRFRDAFGFFVPALGAS